MICGFCAAASLAAFAAHAEVPRVVPSADGTLISYNNYGEGEPALVFVHGWSCDGRYWRNQIPYFAKDYRVLVLDLAGHGHSGQTRQKYSMEAFGEDVRAVMKDAGIQHAILIGHSMGGVVVAEAARGATNEILGLIGVDTLQNVEYSLKPEEAEGMVAPLKEHFQEGCRAFVATMINESTPEEQREWILSDMSAAPSRVALSAMENMLRLYTAGETATLFDEVQVPVIGLMADMWPVNAEANRRHMLSFETMMFEGGDHFLMLNQPDAFNRALKKAVNRLTTGD
ncbi:MAG: alpha/beta hydrolase [Kiritimatiellae bacterium]|nr:alpha/beta hydrolase [Kiritimatiellia bacterium]